MLKGGHYTDAPNAAFIIKMRNKRKNVRRGAKNITVVIWKLQAKQ